MALVALLGILEQSPGADEADALLDKARASLGGVSRLKAVKSLSATGTLERKIGNRSKANVELYFQFPDRFSSKEKTKAFGGRDAAIWTVLNRNDAWMEVDPRPPGIELMGARSAFSEGAEPVALRRAKVEFGRLALALLLASPAALDAEFSRGAEIEVGGRPAVIVNVSGAYGFEVSLYLARDSGQPLKLDYLGRVPAGPFAGGEEDSGVEVIIQEQFADYRLVSGIQIPHRITRLANQRVFEELKLKAVVIDPVLDPKVFARRN